MLKLEYTFQSYGGNHVSGVACTDGREISLSQSVFVQPFLDELGHIFSCVRIRISLSWNPVVNTQSLLMCSQAHIVGIPVCGTPPICCQANLKSTHVEFEKIISARLCSKISTSIYEHNPDKEIHTNTTSMLSSLILEKFYDISLASRHPKLLPKSKST